MRASRSSVIRETRQEKNRASTIDHSYLREFAIREVFKEGTLADRTVADQYQPKLIVEERLHHSCYSVRRLMLLLLLL